MRLSTSGKIEAAAAIGGVSAGIVGAVLLEPVWMVAGVGAAIVATGLQLHESRLRRRVESSFEAIARTETKLDKARAVRQRR